MPSSNLPGSVWPGRPASLFGLASDGACQARHVAVPAGRLLPHRFTLTLPRKAEQGGLLSVALSEGHPSWELPSVLPCEARTFLPVRQTRGMCRAPAAHAATARPAPQISLLRRFIRIGGAGRRARSVRGGVLAGFARAGVKVLAPVNKTLAVGAVQNLVTALQFDEGLRRDHDPAAFAHPGRYRNNDGMGEPPADELVSVEHRPGHLVPALRPDLVQ